MRNAGRRLLFITCLVLAAAFAPAALAQSAIPDLPGDVDDRVPDDVKDRVSDDDGDGEDRDGPSLPEVVPEDLAPDLPEPREVSPRAVLEPPPRPNPFMPSPGSPSGSNDPKCVPTRDKPNPIVLVHGTFEDRNFSWSFVSPMLKGMGYCVYAINYGNNGTIKIDQSAKELKTFIEQEALADGDGGVLGLTGAKKVSIVAHSQGGLMSRVYLKDEGGLGKVEDLVSLAASNHGTDNELAVPAGEQGNCESCLQQFPYERSPRGNPFTAKVNADDETPGDISYTQITTRFDDVVFPYFSAFLADSGSRNGPRTKELNGDNTTNFCLQDEYADFVDHVGTQYDPNTLEVISEALANDGPAKEPDRADSVCAPLAERGASGGGAERDEDGRDRDGNGGGGNGNGGGGSNPTPAPFRPVFSAEAFAFAQCMSLDLAANFRGIANLGRLGRCMAATVDVLASGTTPAAGCRKQRLSTVRGKKRRSDFRACVLAASRATVARRLAGF